MKLTASKLRQDIYRLLDSVLESGEPLEIERNGQILRVVRAHEASGKLSRLRQRKLCLDDPESFTHIDWSKEWSEEKSR